MKRLLPMLPILALVSACQSETASGCGAEDYGWLVGQQLAAVTLPADLGARIVGPDSIVTTDFRPDRLNISVDGSGVIDRVYCG